jgi:hypothetical protein
MSFLAFPILADRPTQDRDPNIYLETIWNSYFSDVIRVNTVEINYCYPWKRRLGLIRLSPETQISFIGLNALLQIEEVPEYLLITTIAHEVAHYVHGFGSPLTRKFKHPHANNVVPQELERRGLGEMMHLCDEWIDKYWFSFYDREREAGWAGLPTGYRYAHTLRKQQP